ncbi:MAG: prohibitin family protein [Thiovulaceae bacterium]|nr:prohibitin family protein [Sulfurimonadaceae bacterium]
MPADMNDYFKKSQKSGGSGGGSGGGPQMPKMPDFNFGGKMWIAYLVIALVVLLFITRPFVIIDEGERGIKVTTGKYEPISMEPGLHFLIPFIQRVITVDTKIRIINYKESADRGAQSDHGIRETSAVTVLDKRGLPVKIELTVQYQLNQQYAAQTIATWGLTWEEKIINPVVRDVVRTVVGNYDAETLPNKRNEIAIAIETEIRKSVDRLENAPAILHSVQLREIGLPQKVKEQIERVQVAKQEVERAQQEVERAKQIAFKAQETARGLAEAKKIEAEGIASAKKIEAEGIAKANNLISRSLTTNLLKLEQMKVQSKFNEALTVNKDAKIFLTPGGSTPNIWVDMKNAKQRTTAK